MVKGLLFEFYSKSIYFSFFFYSGSDIQSIRTRASLSNDGKTFHITGKKIYITNGEFADVMTVFAKTYTSENKVYKRYRVKILYHL